MIRYYCYDCKEYYEGGPDEECPLCKGRNVTIKNR